MARDPRLAALDEAVSRQGAFLVVLLRLSPFAPYNVVNYALSASRVGLVAFAGASLVGMAPITFAWAWAGAAFGGLEGMAGRPPAGPGEQALRWAGSWRRWRWSCSSGGWRDGRSGDVHEAAAL